MNTILDLFLNIDVHLNQAVGLLGVYTYVLLFLIIFCETGLVVTPFLPGDSLLFAVGALCASANAELDVTLVMITLVVAAILGDSANYKIGHFLGEKALVKKYRGINPEHLKKAHLFYEKHGGKTIVLARFLPIIRTFAPFVAGIARMAYAPFLFYNVTGALLWVISLTLSGYFLGQIPWIQQNFEWLVIGLVVIPSLPALFQLLKPSRKATS